MLQSQNAEIFVVIIIRGARLWIGRAGPLLGEDWLFCLVWIRCLKSHFGFYSQLISVAVTVKPHWIDFLLLLIWWGLWHWTIDGGKKSGAYLESSAELSKNAVSSFQVTCKLLYFTLKDSWKKMEIKNQQTINTFW